MIWSAIPVEYRVTNSGMHISPAEAELFLLVPVYNLYWMFVSSGGICDALDGMLCMTSSSRRAPRDLAMAAVLAS